MKQSFVYLSTFLLLVAITFSACKKPDPIIPNEEELITNLTVTLSPSGGGDNRIFTFEDRDGDGGNPPSIPPQSLAPNTTYTGSLALSNELETPAEDIGAEVKEEAEEHQFFFSTSNSLNANITYLDQDADGQPLGLEFSLVTGEASTGQLTITLRHEPMKSASGVSDGDIENAGGETDIEVEFEVTIQ